MNKKSILIIVIATLLLAGLAYILVNEFNQPTAEEISARTTEVYQTEISKYLTAMPTITPQPLPTNTPEISPIPTEIVPILDIFIAEDALLIYERPKFDSDVIGSLGAGESAVWAEERRDYSVDLNWNWYHVQFTDVDKSENELFDGYVAVLTEQGREMTQDVCPAILVDSFKFADAYPFIGGSIGLNGSPYSNYVNLLTPVYTLGNVSTTTYAGVQVDYVNAVMVELDPSMGLPVLLPFNFVIGFQFPDEQAYKSNLISSGLPTEDCRPTNTCGLDYVLDLDPSVVSFQNRHDVVSRFDGVINYGQLNGGGYLGTQFNYYDSSTYSYIYDTSYVANDLIDYPEYKQMQEKYYQFFSKYEMETGDNMNQLFLKGKQVPQNWMNMGFGYTRYLAIPNDLAERGYEQTDALAQCLQAIGSW